MSNIYNDKKIVVTIARQYGSGGRSIGKELAQAMGVNYYDKELITLAAKKHGYSEEVFEKSDEKATHSFLYSLAMGAYSMEGHYVHWGDAAPSMNDQVFDLQSDIIKELAQTESCVIIGRCADYILKDNKNVVSVFISADMDVRVKTITERDGIKEKQEEVIRKTDKRRSNYYSFHTEQQWGDSKNYDLCLNVSELTHQNVVDIILNYIKVKFFS